MIAIVAAVAAIAYGIWLAWNENFLNIRAFTQMLWDGLVQMFGGWFDIIMGIVDFFAALFEGDLDKLWAAVVRIFTGIYNVIVGAFRAILGFIITINIGIARLLWGIINIIIQIGQRVFGFLNDLFGGLPGKLYNWGANMIRGLARGIWSMAGVVMDAILGLFPPWLRDLIKGTGQFIVNVGAGISDFFAGGVAQDFIWRPGSGAQAFSPNDTLVGFKGTSPFEEGGGITVQQENNFHGFTMDELRRELDDRDSRVVDEIRRMVRQ